MYCLHSHSMHMCSAVESRHAALISVSATTWAYLILFSCLKFTCNYRTIKLCRVANQQSTRLNSLNKFKRCSGKRHYTDYTIHVHLLYLYWYVALRAGTALLLVLSARLTLLSVKYLYATSYYKYEVCIDGRAVQQLHSAVSSMHTLQRMYVLHITNSYCCTLLYANTIAASKTCGRHFLSLTSCRLWRGGLHHTMMALCLTYKSEGSVVHCIFNVISKSYHYYYVSIYITISVVLCCQHALALSYCVYTFAYI